MGAGTGTGRDMRGTKQGEQEVRKWAVQGNLLPNNMCSMWQFEQGGNAPRDGLCENEHFDGFKFCPNNNTQLLLSPTPTWGWHISTGGNGSLGFIEIAVIFQF